MWLHVVLAAEHATLFKQVCKQSTRMQLFRNMTMYEQLYGLCWQDPVWTVWI